jgi:hypothetical protein
MEYICTKLDTINTGINIDTVKESKLKLQNKIKDSESIHLNNLSSTGIEFRPTSIKIKIDKRVVREIDIQVIRWVPCTPIFLPSNPGSRELNKGNKINVRYIKSYRIWN